VILMNTLHAVPAYGRSYKTNEDLITDWLDGKDFKIEGGSYFSIRDYEMLSVTLGYDDIAIKFDDLPIASVCYIPLFTSA
jgi:hypothetical protein